MSGGGDSNYYSPSFAMNGEKIVYESGGKIWMINSNGTGGRRKIPGSGLGYDVDPDISSENLLVFTSLQYDYDDMYQEGLLMLYKSIR